MSQERTEKATPKKREEARREGRVARSADLPAAFGFMGALLALNYLGGSLFSAAGFYVQDIAREIASTKELTPLDMHTLFLNAGKALAIISLPAIGIAFVAGVAGSFAQGGFSISAAALKPKAEKFNPVTNLKRVFGLDSIMNLAKSLIKMLLIGAVTYGVLWPLITEASLLINEPPVIIASKLGEALFGVAFRAGLVLIFMAAADYGYAYFRFEKSIMMSKHEIREEFKENEGDPAIKSQRRRSARMLAQKRSLTQVPSATVIITNPTHIAIALRYDRDKDAAPAVVAKGADKMAEKIREIAKENQIPLVENKPLARALYKMAELDRIIPPEFFGPVAEILAFVFKERHGQQAR